MEWFMPVIILDSCSFTRIGLSDYLISQGVKKKRISSIDSIETLNEQCLTLQPQVVFINEECFMNQDGVVERIKAIIDLHPGILFFIFMANNNVQFNAYLFVRSNLLISSKSINPAMINQIMHQHSEERNSAAVGRPLVDPSPVSLSRTEASMLKMWMSGYPTEKISTSLNIKAKTVSSHKANIKRKIKTHNKQVIYNVVRLAESLTNGLYVNRRQQALLTAPLN